MSDYFVGITGASGHLYARTLVRGMLAAGHGVHVALTPAGCKVMAHELGLEPGANGLGLRDLVPDWLQEGGELDQLGPGALDRVWVHGTDDVGAKPASGTAGIAATILCPCSMGSLARVAAGFSSNLVERAADVALKEGRSLLLMPRETPLSLIHLENMARLARMGAVILPCMPGLYHGPRSMQDLIDHVAAKALDRLGVAHSLGRPWQGLEDVPEEAGTENPDAPTADTPAGQAGEAD